MRLFRADHASVPAPDRAVRLLALAALLVGAVACGGTNSETPWPVEPEDVDLGPEGEARKNEQLRGAPRGKTAPGDEAASPAPAASTTPAPADPAPATPATQF